MNPYSSYPERQKWFGYSSGESWIDAFDGETSKLEGIGSKAVSSLGSCFASRISSYLIGNGFNYPLFEPYPDFLVANDSQNPLFSCRYGFVYTVDSLYQLVNEVSDGPLYRFGVSRANSRNVIDLLRPDVGTFDSEESAELDRQIHIERVREMFTRTRVLAVTLGLTEGWRDGDGVVYGQHPAITSVTTDSYYRYSSNYETIRRKLAESLLKIRAINKSIEFVITVSPVLLKATHQPKHCVVASMDAKAKLRAVSACISDEFEFVDYFPSFEIVALAQSHGYFLDGTLRSVDYAKTDLIMRSFSRWLGLRPHETCAGPQNDARSAAAQIIQKECDDISEGIN